MKKVLVVLLIPIIFISFTFDVLASIPHIISIDSMGELIELRKMLEADEEDLINYLRQSQTGIRNREELEALLSLLDSFPIPIINGKELNLNALMYNPERNSIPTISYDSDDGYFYSFSIRDYRSTTAEEFIKQTYNEEAILLHQSEDGNVKVYAYPQALLKRVEPGAENNSGEFVMDFHGYFVWVIYSHRSIKDYSTVSAEQLLGGVTLGSIEFLEAMHEREPAFIIPLTTADALDVLRHVAQLTTLTRRQMTRFEISGRPTTEDAMRILRVVAGL